YGSYQASPLGLYDMSGNVYERCWDWYNSDYYANSKNTIDPKGPSTGSGRVVRGGGWYSRPRDCRAASRVNVDLSFRSDDIGFRLVLSSR
ncbi:MAG: SUMF1/EgtB/PvdO family nonheme iron enzyme, partial [Bacteroidota bacterium]